MIVKAINQATGEVMEVEAGSLVELVSAWNQVSETEKACKRLKDQLKKLVSQYVDSKGTSDLQDGFMFRVSNVQRMTYDKAVLREQLDEDTVDLLLKPDKTAVDAYLKENLSDLGEASTVIRKSMIPDGSPYTVIKLERIK